MRFLNGWKRWTHSSSNNIGIQSLLTALDQNGLLLTNQSTLATLRNAFIQADRAYFLWKNEEENICDEAFSEHWIPKSRLSEKYLPLGNPIDDAMQLELLSNHIKPGARILDCGSGAGFLSTVMALIALEPNSGFLTSIDRSPSLIDVTLKRLAKTLVRHGKNNVLENIIMMPLDGTTSDTLPAAPFDVIRVGYALPALECEESVCLLRQLRPGGRMIASIDKNPKKAIFDRIDGGHIDISFSDAPTRHLPNICEHKVAIETEDPQEAAKIKAVMAQRETEKNKVILELQEWKTEFEKVHQRRPTRHDMMSDPQAIVLFQKFAKLNK